MALTMKTFIALCGCLSTLTLVTLWVLHNRHPNFDGLVWVGLRKEWFPKLRTSLRYKREGLRIVDDGYRKFSKHGKPFVTPLSTTKPMVVVPPSDIEWLAKRPRSDVLPPQMVLHPELVHYYFPKMPAGEFTHMPTINVDLKKITPEIIWRQVSESVPVSFDAGVSIDKARGGDEDDDWQTRNLFEILGGIVGRVSVGIFLSKRLARDSTFIETIIMYGLTFNSFPYQLHDAIPKPLRRFYVPLIAAPSRYYLHKLHRWLLPLIQQHLDGEEADEDRDTVLYHHVKWAQKSADPQDRDPRVIISRLVLMIAALALPTLYQSLSDSVTNLTRQSPDGEDCFQAVLRREVDELLAEASEDIPPKGYALRLVHMNSFLKETLRYHTFNGFGLGLNREVVAEKGLTLPSAKDGPILPKGTWLSAAYDAIHRDPENYEAPDEFMPWRFVSPSGDNTADVTDTSDTWLPFGRGRDTCPGRFFAADYMRLVMLYLVQNFDVRAPGKLPKGSAPSIDIRPRGAR
ncbi:Putative cytochrome P450 [Colletotrichum destructivum]|uniref:Cytochrome P450 n=1 Tax=Colletotrichum destructivum TaxID=34406 RepID=A0AAX4J0X2_9PEZI|nr:Putative cytochrome P450 [Colletotrichum destructivum]